MATPVPDKDNHISCRWDVKKKRYVTLAEDWHIKERKRERIMRYKELLEILKEMEEKSPDMLQQKVSLAGDNAEVELQFAYTLGAAPRLYFVYVYVAEDDDAG